MLALPKNTKYLHEPFNDRFTVKTFRETPFPHWFMYVTERNQFEYSEKVSRMIGLQPVQPGLAMKSDNSSPPAAAIPVVKDPIAVFSSHWLANRFGLDVVFLIRHPAAVVHGLLKLGWHTDPRIFLKQRLLMDETLAGFHEEIQRIGQSGDKLMKAALVWKLIYHAASVYRRSNPDWLFVRHEDLAADPEEGFEGIYARYGLTYTVEVKDEIARYSDRRNPAERPFPWQIRRHSAKCIDNWVGSFTRDQIHAIREVVEPVSYQYYADADWDTPK